MATSRDATLLAFLAALNAAEDETAAVRALAEHALALTGASAVEACGFLDGQASSREMLRDDAWRSLACEPSAGESIAGRALALGRPCRCDDLDADLSADRQAAGPSGFRAQLSVPVIAGERLGVVSLYHTETGRAFSDGEAALVETMAGHAAVAVARARSRAALAASERRFRALVQNATDIVALLDAAGTVLYASPATASVLGHEPATLLGTNVTALVHPDDLPRARQGMASTLSFPGAHPPIELRARRADGAWADLEVRSTNLLHDPELRGIVLNARDVTDRVRAETELRASEARFRALVQNATDLIVTIDAAGTIGYASPSAGSVLGYEPGDVLGKNWLSFIHPEDHPPLLSEFAALLGEPGGTRAGSLRLRMADGAWRWVEGTGTNLLRDPAVAGVVLNFRDVTERREAEAALREADLRALAAHEQLLERLGTLAQTLGAAAEVQGVFRALRDFVLRFTPGTGLFVSRYDADRSERICVYAYSDGEEVDVSTLPPMPMNESPHSRAVSTGECIVTDDFEAATRGLPRVDLTLEIDPRRPRSSLAVPMRVMGRPVGGFEIQSPIPAAFGGEHVTAMRMAANLAAMAFENARLLEGERDRRNELQQLVARLFTAQEDERRHVAYELHDGAAQMVAAAHQHLQAYARRARPRRPEARERLDRALELSQRAVRETRRVVAGLRPTVLDDFGLEAALRQDVDALAGDGRDVRLDTNLGAERVPAHLEAALYRVAQEAITNARKHAGDSRLAVRLRRRGERLTLSVQDWGRGFDPAAVTRAAGPGERVGLAGMQERVRLLGGRLSVESAPGKGTRIRAVVPLPPAET